MSLGGRRVPVTRPRMRATDGSGELPVPGYELFSGTEVLGRVALVPGVGDTLRVNGRARLVSAAPYLDALAVEGVRPDVAVEVRVEELYLHCGKAFVRSAFWDPVTWPLATRSPSAGRITRSQTGTRIPAGVLDAAFRRDARVNRY